MNCKRCNTKLRLKSLESGYPKTFIYSCPKCGQIHKYSKRQVEKLNQIDN